MRFEGFFAFALFILRSTDIGARTWRVQPKRMMTQKSFAAPRLFSWLQEPLSALNIAWFRFGFGLLLFWQACRFYFGGLDSRIARIYHI